MTLDEYKTVLDWFCNAMFSSRTRRNVRPSTRWKLYAAAFVLLFSAKLVVAGEIVSLLKVADAKHATGSGPVPNLSTLPKRLRLRGVVTALSGWRNSFFLQDESGGISVDRSDNTEVHPGQEVEALGTIRPGLFAPLFVADRVNVLGTGRMPRALVPNDAEMEQGKLDSRRIRVSGIVHSAEVNEIWGHRVLILSLYTGNHSITVHVLHFDGISYSRLSYSQLIDSRVQLEGVCGSIFNDRRQLIGLRLFLPSLADVQVLESAPDPFLQPPAALNSVGTFEPGTLRNHRVHVAGVVSYRTSSGLVFLQNPDGSVLRMQTSDPRTLDAGTKIDAVGFLSPEATAPSLHNATIRVVGLSPAVRPQPIQATDAIRSADGFRFAPYDGRLVVVEGKVVDILSQSDSPTLLIREGLTAFQAELPAKNKLADDRVEIGSRVRLTGICVAEFDDAKTPRSFRLLLRSINDVKVIDPFRRTFSGLFLAAILLFLFSGGFLIWIIQRDWFTWRKRSGSQSRPAWYPGGVTLLAFLVGTVAGLALTGWAMGIPTLTRIGPQYSAMKVETAIALIAGALALQLSQRKQTKWYGGLNLCLALTAAIALGSLVGARTHWEDLALARLMGSASQPMAQVTAVSLLLWSGGLWATVRGKQSGVTQLTFAGQSLALLVGSLSLLNAACYLYGMKTFTGTALHAAMSPQTAVCVLSLSAGTLLTSVGQGFMRIVKDDGLGGFLARQMLPAALLIPIVLGWFRWQGEVAGLYDGQFGVALFASANAISFAFLIWNGASTAGALNAARAAASKQLELREAELRKRDEQVNFVFEQGALGDWVYEFSTDQVTAHPILWKLYGEVDRSGSAPSEWFLQRQHPDDRERSAKALSAAVAAKTPLDAEFRVVWPDGSVHWIACRGAATYGADGTPLQLHGVNFDVTARKESESQFRRLADAMPQIVWTADPDGRVNYLNGKWYEFSGFDPSHEKQGWLQVLHPDDVEPALVTWANALRSGLPYEQEYRFWDYKRDTYRWHLGRALSCLDERDNLIGWFGTFTDIDDYKRVQEQLRHLNNDLENVVRERSSALLETERSLRRMIEGVKDYSICMLNPDGDIISWNSGAERLKGYTAVEAIGKNFSIFHLPEEIAAGRPRQKLTQALLDGEFHEEGPRVRKDGSTFWASVLITPILDGTQLRGFSKITRDVSERKQATEALKEARERAESANRAKSAFLAVMSHEIRTPMNAILGMAEVLAGTELNESQRRYVETFRRSGDSLLTLINDILDLSKIEAGQMKLESSPFDLGSMAKDVVALFDARAALKNIALVLDLPASAAIFVAGDATRLRQVLLNLVGNSVKFTSAGEVKLSIRHDPANETVRFAVSDTGIGIPADKLATVFEDFAQADSSTTRKFGGTGLGLGISRRLVEMMGGRIAVESIVGMGSTFHFTIPLRRVPGPDSPATESAPSDPMNKTAQEPLNILIAEDTPENQLVLQAYLEETAHHLTFAEDGKSAADLATRGAFDLILMDIRMPVMDGLTATRIIREQEVRLKKPHVPIIALTADAGSEDIERSRSAGCDGHLTKPISKRVLFKALQDYSRSGLRPMVGR